MPDFSTGLREVAERLYDLGHRRYAFLAARSTGQRVGGRPSIFQKIIGEFESAQAEVVVCGPLIEEAREVGREILGGDERPTAIVTLNDLTAIGVMRAAKDLGVRVPEDLSVVGIDGIPLGEYLPVSLSTIAQPHQEMAAKAVEFLIDRIEGEGRDLSREATFETNFVERESIGPLM